MFNYQSVEQKIRKCCDVIVNKDLSHFKSLRERSTKLIKTLNVGRRVIKNLLNRPTERKCKVLKKKQLLL